MLCSRAVEDLEGCINMVNRRLWLEVRYLTGRWRGPDSQVGSVTARYMYR